MNAIFPQDFPDLLKDLLIPCFVQDAAARHAQDLSAYEDVFRRYAAEEKTLCRRDPAPMELKAAHTMRVLENTSLIAQEEHFPPETARACHLAALFHDISRFDQYRLWGTFRDRESCDHAELSAFLLRKAGILDHEPAAKAILGAIALHNRRDLPEGPDDLERTAACAVRDADRLDIMRIIDLHLSAKNGADPDVIVPVPDDNALFSLSVIDSVMRRASAGYAEIRSANDFRLVVAGWFYLMRFGASRRLAAARGHARRLVEKLPQPYAEVRARLLADLDAAQR